MSFERNTGLPTLALGSPKIGTVLAQARGVSSTGSASLREGGFVQNCTSIRERALRMSVLLTHWAGKGRALKPTLANLSNGKLWKASVRAELLFTDRDPLKMPPLPWRSINDGG